MYVQCALCIVNCALCIVNCALCIEHCALCIEHCAYVCVLTCSFRGEDNILVHKVCESAH